MSSYPISRLIISVAREDIGIKETGNNEGFSSPFFQNSLERLGWKIGQPWCMYAVMRWWQYGYSKYDSRKIEKLQGLMSGLAMQTWNNFKKSKDFKTGKTPMTGAIAIWQKYKNGKGTWQGHAGIVDSYTRDEIISIDGNPNKRGSREGQEVATKRRQREFSVHENGLVLKGFIYPIS